MKQGIFLFGLFAIVACHDNKDMLDYSVTEENSDKKTEYITITPEEAVEQALIFKTDLLSQSGATRVNKTEKSVSSVYAWRSSEIAANTITRSSFSTSLPDTLLYIVNFEDNCGYALVSANLYVPGVVAYVEEGMLTPDEEIDNPGMQLFLDGYKEYVEQMQIRDGGFPYMVPWRLVYNVPPLLTTNWGQNAPYNKYCFTDSGYQAKAGCVPIATGQIAAFHRHPLSYNGHNYNWNAIMQYEQVPITDTIASNSVAEFIHDIGVLENTNYGTGSSSTNFNNVANCWNAFDYHYLRDDSTAVFDSIKVDVSDGYPVYMRGTRYYIDENGNWASSGHAWVVDGVAIKGFIQEVSDIPPHIYMTYQNLIHCNWGWNGNCNGYFIIGAFENLYNLEDLTYIGGQRPYNFDNYTYRHIYPNNPNN